MATGTTAEQIIDVVTPAAGESVTEGTILEWHVKVGESIKVDATIVEISTDKVDVELPAPASGVVSELLVAEGDTVTVGQVIARIAVGADAPAPSSEGNGSSSPAAESATEPEAEAPAAESATEPEAEAPAPAGDDDASHTGNGSGSGTAATPEAGASAPRSASEGGAASGRLIDVVTPAAGESVTEGTILEWRVKSG